MKLKQNSNSFLFGWAIALALIASSVGLGSGCAMEGGQAAWGGQRGPKGPPSRQEIYRETDSNVIRVYKFISSEPWLSFKGQGAGTVDGLKMTVYLESGNKPKGVFGDGSIVVTMYQLDRDSAGREVPTQIYEWVLPPEVAYSWRAKQPTGMGSGYGLRLHWGEGLDIAGREVAIVVKYIRTDGRVVTSSRQVRRVPESEGNLYLKKPQRTVTPRMDTGASRGEAVQASPRRNRD